MSIKRKIQKTIKNTINILYPLFQSFEKEGIEVLVEVPGEKIHGDYSTNIALILSKKLNKPPLEIAKTIVDKINYSLIRTNKRIVEKVESAPPGFINFYLSKDFFVDSIKKIDKDFGKNDNLKNQKVIVEYTDPNPFKKFHIGHLMSNAIGESISRILEFQGAEIKRANYQGDVGLHVAKAIFGKLKNPKYSWQSSYVFGAENYEDNKQEITDLNKKIFERSDDKINKLYDQGKKETLNEFEKIYKKLGTKFDYSFFESKVAGFGKKIVEAGLKKGIFEKGERGAIIFNGEKQGLHKRVFVNSEGFPTYEAKELGLAKVKYGKYKYDKSIIITGNEINQYFMVLLAAMSEIFPDLAEKTKHIGHGMMRLVSGKMSSRTGQVVTAESLIGEAQKMIFGKLAGRKFSKKEKKEIAEQVAIGAIKYSILKQSIGSDVIYNPEKSISFEGDSGPYLQYSLVRANSVLKKAKAEGVSMRIYKFTNDANYKVSGLEKMMHRFPEVVEESGKEYEPHYIVLYLTELAREFNNYYAKEKIVDKKDKLSPYKIALARAFSIIMKNGLRLLGIPAPEKM